MSSSDRLSTPGRERRLLPKVRMDSEVFGSFAEGFARFMGTASFLIWMTVIIVAWIAWNVFAPAAWAIDPFPFIFLTLLLSLQASYAAPLILLAQNRQEARERVSLEHDREVAAQARADVERSERELRQAGNALLLLTGVEDVVLHSIRDQVTRDRLGDEHSDEVLLSQVVNLDRVQMLHHLLELGNSLLPEDKRLLRLFNPISDLTGVSERELSTTLLRLKVSCSNGIGAVMAQPEVGNVLVILLRNI